MKSTSNSPSADPKKPDLGKSKGTLQNAPVGLNVKTDSGIKPCYLPEKPCDVDSIKISIHSADPTQKALTLKTQTRLIHEEISKATLSEAEKLKIFDFIIECVTGYPSHDAGVARESIEFEISSIWHGKTCPNAKHPATGMTWTSASGNELLVHNERHKKPTHKWILQAPALDLNLKGDGLAALSSFFSALLPLGNYNSFNFYASSCGCRDDGQPINKEFTALLRLYRKDTWSVLFEGVHGFSYKRKGSRGRYVLRDGKFSWITEDELRLGDSISTGTQEGDTNSSESTKAQWWCNLSIARNGQKFNPREIIESIETVREKLRAAKSVIEKLVDFRDSFRKYPQVGWYFDFTVSFLEGYWILTAGLQELTLRDGRLRSAGLLLDLEAEIKLLVIELKIAYGFRAYTDFIDTGVLLEIRGEVSIDISLKNTLHLFPQDSTLTEVKFEPKMVLALIAEAKASILGFGLFGGASFSGGFKVKEPKLIIDLNEGLEFQGELWLDDTICHAWMYDPFWFGLVSMDPIVVYKERYLKNFAY
ncbi:hypothetical protein SAMN05444354_1214 [Stigmatella aurantiaca]|uniref:Uncharacterized protein n=1 Tax=Stigmatella aurantiaca TaxID=41 RepID=A0A1H8AEZ2_STIAU|nr:hypothetical protein [Stigmatella aurantiaca]SEM68107.1 hypothetical protein SAMN05444354_1214 [Stigmatella aurantiaca]